MTRLSSPFVFGVLTLGLFPGFAAAEVDFETEIRPILAEKCLLCHGPDDESGGLRLTGLEFATRELDSGMVGIRPGKPDESEIIFRIHETDPAEVMPPPKKAEPLTEKEKTLLSQWIAEGASWPQHWAYTDLEKSPLPKVKQTDWAGHPIDAYVLARLEAEGVSPSPGADAVTLVRRLHYDLVGLPPAPEVVDRYRELIETSGEQGIETLVDELLASPHFGERWGRHWLDKARYADSDGYEKDNNRMNAWRYRDWVIDAINADLPFDQFTIQQFAGDLLPEPTADQRLATAFNRQTLTNTEGGTDKEQWRVAAVMDRVETMGAVWMGLTLTCARCHTHKYDEVTQAEYYQLFAYFNNGDETDTKVPRSAEDLAAFEAAMAVHAEELDAARARAAAARQELGNRMLEWEAQAQTWMAEAALVKEPRFLSLPLAKVAGPKGVKLESGDDGVIRVTGQNPASATYTLTGQLAPGTTFHGIRIEVLADESLGGKGPGRSSHGNFVLNDLQLSIEGYPYNPLIFAEATADFSQDDWEVNEALDGNAKPGKDGSGWAVSGQLGQDHAAVFALSQPVTIDRVADFSLALIQNYGSQHTLGKFRVSLLQTPTIHAIPVALRHVLNKAESTRTAEEQASLAAHFERIDSRTAPLLAAVKALEARLPSKPEMDVRVLSERSRARRGTHVFHRGEFKQPEQAVEADTPAVLPAVEHRGEEGDRLDLARWLVSGRNPLPPRVVANEIWANLFGAGLVTTLNDFGVRGDRPSHPDLLDWIAAEFVESGWSRKKLIKSIVMSRTYRQRSDHRPELETRDPKNRLLARQNRFRVEAEIVRDLSLASAGLLSAKQGGPSVFPPIPPGVADVNYNSAFKWKVSPGEDRYRRGMYTFFKRTAPHPNLMTFDCPDSNVTCVKRTRSNTPLAALITLNNQTFVEASQGLAQRVLAEVPGEDDAARIIRAFRHCVARRPEAGEIDRLVSLLETSRAYYREHPEDASLLAGEAFADQKEIPAAEAAAWVASVRVILNLDEFLTRS